MFKIIILVIRIKRIILKVFWLKKITNGFSNKVDKIKKKIDNKFKK